MSQPRITAAATIRKTAAATAFLYAAVTPASADSTDVNILGRDVSLALIIGVAVGVVVLLIILICVCCCCGCCGGGFGCCGGVRKRKTDRFDQRFQQRRRSSSLPGRRRAVSLGGGQQAGSIEDVLNRPRPQPPVPHIQPQQVIMTSVPLPIGSVPGTAAPPPAMVVSPPVAYGPGSPSLGPYSGASAAPHLYASPVARSPFGQQQQYTGAMGNGYLGSTPYAEGNNTINAANDTISIGFEDDHSEFEDTYTAPAYGRPPQEQGETRRRPSDADPYAVQQVYVSPAPVATYHITPAAQTFNVKNPSRPDED